MRSTTVATLLLATFRVTQSILLQPPDNQVLLGFWPDTRADHDTPAALNARLGLNAPVFQIAQNIPRAADGAAPEKLIEDTNTNAAIFLTVYPTKLVDVTQKDIDDLAQQIHDYPNRTVFLRYAPEMNAYWARGYMEQPTKFVQQWKQVHAAVKAKAPFTQMVWAPFSGQYFPGIDSFTENISPEDVQLLDTDHDGKWTTRDDPWAAYWPGDEFVDWAGMSVYHRGMGYGTTGSEWYNDLPPMGFCANVWEGTGATGSPMNFYKTYCERNPNIACMFSESGIAFHVADKTTASQLQMQKAWINDCIANPLFLTMHPRIKMVMQYEQESYETETDLRDYRITTNPEVLAELKRAISAISDRFYWAKAGPPTGPGFAAAATPSPTPSPAGQSPPPPPPSSSSTTHQSQQSTPPQNSNTQSGGKEGGSSGAPKNLDLSLALALLITFAAVASTWA